MGRQRRSRFFSRSVTTDQYLLNVRANRDHRKVRVAEPQGLWNALGTVIEAEEKLDRSPQGLARTLALIAVDSLEDVSGRRMLEMLGYASRDAEQQALRRARRAAAAEPRLRELVERALELVQVVPGTT